MIYPAAVLSLASPAVAASQEVEPCDFLQAVVDAAPTGFAALQSGDDAPSGLSDGLISVYTTIQPTGAVSSRTTMRSMPSTEGGLIDVHFIEVLYPIIRDDAQASAAHSALDLAMQCDIPFPEGMHMRVYVFDKGAWNDEGDHWTDHQLRLELTYLPVPVPAIEGDGWFELIGLQRADPLVQKVLHDPLTGENAEANGIRIRINDADRVSSVTLYHDSLSHPGYAGPLPKGATWTTLRKHYRFKGGDTKTARSGDYELSIHFVSRRSEFVEYLYITPRDADFTRPATGPLVELVELPSVDEPADEPVEEPKTEPRSPPVVQGDAYYDLLGRHRTDPVVQAFLADPSSGANARDNGLSVDFWDDGRVASVTFYRERGVSFIDTLPGGNTWDTLLDDPGFHWEEDVYNRVAERDGLSFLVFMNPTQGKEIEYFLVSQTLETHQSSQARPVESQAPSSTLSDLKAAMVEVAVGQGYTLVKSRSVRATTNGDRIRTSLGYPQIADAKYMVVLIAPDNNVGDIEFGERGEQGYLESIPVDRDSHGGGRFVEARASIQGSQNGQHSIEFTFKYASLLGNPDTTELELMVFEYR